MVFIYTILMRNGDTFRKVWSKSPLSQIDQQIRMKLDFIRFENCIVRRDEISTISLDRIAYEEQKETA